MNVLIIIYLEGDFKTSCKQEKFFWEDGPSKRIWDKVFKHYNFQYFLIQLLPKRISNDEDLEKFLKIIDDKISGIYKKIDSKKIDFLKILITGDHDEKKEKILKERENLASKLNFFLENRKENKIIKIILERNKNFKLESLISIVIGKKINKKILKINYKNKFPNILKLFYSNEENKIVEKIISNINKSNHSLFKEIKNKN